LGANFSLSHTSETVVFEVAASGCMTQTLALWLLHNSRLCRGPKVCPGKSSKRVFVVLKWKH
jgi:hypothetical protein